MLQDRIPLPSRPPRPPRILGIPLILALTWSAEARADERGKLHALVPENVTVTAGALFPTFLIYENPGPWVGAEVGWRTSAHTQVVANAGMSVIWTQGSQRYLGPLGVSLRVFPWENVGPWAQVGLGAIPYVEQMSVLLPQRIASATDVGATLTAKVQIGARFWGFDLGLGVDFNLLPSPFYEKYTGIETLPWDNTFMVWLGRQVWTRRPS
ncbi:hypothetical protein [Polyangium sorediatum]|uniref:Outer membrane protein beta-barrel domain-containing protein n=1 Tax=Polyangium sorediatum TaxID=889274 RepID=A0ABT6NWF7_9BACT|nr:hypothetical protein [Polyangium sorediatum]MDI1432687.1 hypothetical protein [Polyangium sorediatum]